MFCQICGKAPVNTHIDTPQGTVHLCSACALKRLKGESLQEVAPHINLNQQIPGQQAVPQGMNPVAQIIAMIPMMSAQVFPREEIPEISCEDCGSSFKEFLMSGSFGCSGCYEAFAYEIRKQIVAAQGSCRYTGKSPSRQFKHLKILKIIDRLRDQLDREVENENYETAAQLRDTIKNLELEVEKFI